jgi:mannose-6-phosphate isomerase-like protein (cupin superfamily)
VKVNLPAIKLKQKLALISEHWSPKIIAQMNDYHFKLAKVKGEFVWHNYADTDEVFIVLEGNLDIELRDGVVTLNKGEMFVVPQGIEHKPVAKEECHVMLVEPAGTVNTGDVSGELTAAEEWI